MTLVELNKIEQVLKENKTSKIKAKALFTETMREKYCEEGDCWWREKMNAAEKETYDKLISESDEASDIYKSFTEHNWQ